MVAIVLGVNYFRYRNFVGILRLISPIVFAWLVFAGIADFRGEAFFGKYLTTSLLSSYETSSVNVCALESYLNSGVPPNELGALIRRAQTIVLLDEMSKFPVFGTGFGYVIQTCIRSEGQPWRFELGLLSLTMNVGIFGMLVYAIAYLWWLWLAVRQGLLMEKTFPLIAGSILFIACSATNPYIFSVENIWIYFIPYLIGVFSLCHRVRISVARS